MLEAIGGIEIGDDNILIKVEEASSLRPEVTVNDFALVDVPYTGYKLCGKAERLLCFEKAMGENVIEQFTTRGTVENDADVVIGFDNVVQSDYVWVLEHPVVMTCMSDYGTNKHHKP